MSWAVRTIGMILLAACPAALPAQTTSDSRPLTPQQSDRLLPLKPHGPEHTEKSKQPDGLQQIVTIVGSLAAVLGIFFLIVWVFRRASPQGMGSLPAEAFETLGRAPLSGHQQVHLLRCGSRLLLVAVGTSAAGNSASTLTEITDPAEVDRLVRLCQKTRAGSSTVAFRQAFRQVGDRHA
jgi:flagellar biogenesis protein FliO